jgi:hypothetical protein
MRQVTLWPVNNATLHPFNPSDRTRIIMAETTKREGHLRELAEELQFSVEKQGDRFTLTRTADLSRPERQSDLTLDQMEDLLRRWKLRGLGGG